FKGHSDVSMYQEGDVNKYTIGETTDYNEIQRIRKKLLSDFPEAFIVAFKDGKKISVQEALAGSKKK
ncbi:MAG: N-acetylmuramoyl-L-alanine amidase, partial [Prevotella sp.]|nr:N-acetylmuramoyl-L-alanine amidase [Prevotella sp.]